MAGFNPTAFIRNVKAAVRPAAVKGLELAGAAIAADVRNRIATQGPPRSAPGEAPHKDSGLLYLSVWWEVDEVNLRVYIVADTPYAYLLEYGTARMAPRPFLRRGVAKAATLASDRIALAFAAPYVAVDRSLQTQVAFAGAGSA